VKRHLDKLRRAAAMPPSAILAKLDEKLRRDVSQAMQSTRDRSRSTYGEHPGMPRERLSAHFSAPPVALLREFAGSFRQLAEEALAHRFEILGSQPTEVVYGMTCSGMGGHLYRGESGTPDGTDIELLTRLQTRRNRPRAQRIRCLIDDGYRPIDWQRDFKSGYRWSEQTWCGYVPIGHVPGVDVIVPWGLSRMQFLPVLCWSYALAGAGESGFRPPEIYSREYRNQVLDFIAANPPRFGVNWRCPMDVAIRVANWLLAYDLLRASSARFDNAFESELLLATADHGQFVFDHLEWNHGKRGNHYLLDLVGLLFAAAYLPSSPETRRWMARAVAELALEADSQFLGDGTHVERSPSYHALCAQALAYGHGLIERLSDERRQEVGRDIRSSDPRHPRRRDASLAQARRAALEALEHHGLSAVCARARRFLDTIAKNDGSLPQFGDGDNARLFRLQVPRPCPVAVLVPEADPATAATAPRWTPLEDMLDSSGVCAALAAVNGMNDDHPSGRIEWTLLSGATNNRLGQSAGASPPSSAEGVVPEDGPLVSRFDEGGFYCFRSERLYLVIRCGSWSSVGANGHMHNDQLSFELAYDGVDILVDPGTFVYTPLPFWRNRLRSSLAHNGPVIEGSEQNPMSAEVESIFWLPERTHARAVEVGRQIFVGEHVGYGGVCRRRIEVDRDRLRIADADSEGREVSVFLQFHPALTLGRVDQHAWSLARSGVEVARVTVHLGEAAESSGWYSPGYGQLVPAPALRLVRSRSLEWSIQPALSGP
jgi:hypothetical protein